MILRRSLERAAALFGAAAVLLAAGAAGATIARYLPLDEHVAQSAVVARVRIGDSRVFVGSEGRPRTDTTIELVEVWKGAHVAGDLLVVRQMRGPVGEGGFLRIPGDAELREGQELVLFLAVDEKGVHYLTSMGQSKYDVVRGEGGPVVRRDLEGLAFYVEGGPEKIVVPPREADVALSIFADTVRELARGGAR